MNSKPTLKKLNESFGSYKAEWLKGKIFNLFAEPSYFTALQDNRPCVLEGGRGTGKTTVLRGLSYQGQFAIHNNSIDTFDNNSFIGIYQRVDTNHVRAFLGGGIGEDIWKKVFSHYFNITICRDILHFIKWHNSLSPFDEALPEHACNLIAKSIHIQHSCVDLESLIKHCDIEMYNFQAKVNNLYDGPLPNVSLAGDPIKIVTEYALSLTQFKDKIFFILLDEYENYADYQQTILNSLIKHTTENYTFKIGVRELGWRVKHTLNPLEYLLDPSDYVLINIENKLTESESQFSEFAKSVCQQRINELYSGEDGTDYDIEKAFQTVTIEQEAILLGVSETEQFKSIEKLDKKYKAKIEGLPELYHFFISYWALEHNSSLSDTIDDYIRSKDEWDTRYENYKYEMLFKIRKGRGKRGIQKYYSGWNTYTKLANGNIRYLIELVYKANEKHFEVDASLKSPISPKNQTLAAQEVGLKNLMELEGLWKNGAQLTKLLLGFGRVFQVLAASDGKSAPEKNQFSIENSEIMSKECDEIITAAVMNLALVRSPGNKLNSEAHTKDYIYMIHPIYSAYFVFSHRKKRKIIVKQEDILEIISSPSKTIKNLLNKSKVSKGELYHLPTQMTLFENFYND